jgi:hypothetical protein
MGIACVYSLLSELGGLTRAMTCMKAAFEAFQLKLGMGAFSSAAQHGKVHAGLIKRGQRGSIRQSQLSRLLFGRDPVPVGIFLCLAPRVQDLFFNKALFSMIVVSAAVSNMATGPGRTTQGPANT